MHDPMTVAFEIRYPWWRKSKFFPNGYHDPFITIWHVDPEKDGSDDSCGYTFPKLGDREKKVVDEMADWDSKIPYYFQHPAYVHNPKYDYLAVSPGDCVALCYAALQEVAWKLDKKRMNWKLTKLAMDLGTNSCDNMQASFAAQGDTAYQITDAKRRAFHCIVRQYMWAQRRWWQHPKWHFRHWKIQIHPLQDFKRWAFSRCSKCSKGFSWGYAPVSGSWNGGGPQWFKSERNTYHSDCDNPKSEAMGAVKSPA